MARGEMDWSWWRAGLRYLLAGLALAALLLDSRGAQAGEEPPAWALTLGVGLEGVQSRDEMGSPFLYAGRGYPLWLGGRRRGERWDFGMEAKGFSSGLNGERLQASRAREGAHQAEAVSIDGALFLLRRIGVGAGGGHRLFLGGEVNGWTFFRSYKYDEYQIGAVEIWEAPLTLNGRAELVRSFGSLELSAAAILPLGGRMMRPNYAVRGDERIDLVENRRRIFRFGSWSTWNRLQIFRAEAGLRWQRGPVGLRAEAGMGLLRYRGELETRAARGRLLFGAEFHF